MENLKPNSANTSPLTPIGFLERAATVYGDSPSVVFNDTVYTWSETYQRCLCLASSMVAELGIKRRQVVSVVALNIPAMCELHFAVPMAGAVLNTLNTRLDARTISVMLRHGESKLIFVEQQFVSLVLDAVSLFPENTPTPRLVLISDESPQEPPSPVLTNGCFYCSYEELVERGDSGFQWLRPETEWDPIVLNYTSGTTSSPKGVVHCHRGIFIVSMDSLVDWAVPKQPVFLWTLPMFHSNGWTYPWGMAAVGGTHVCLRKFDGPFIFDLIRRHGVTHMCGAPVVLNMLSNTPNAKPLDSPVHVMTAGAPPPSAVLQRTEALGFVISHGYGMTEAGGVVISCAWKGEWNRLPATERARLKARQGVRTASMVEVDVVDPNSCLSVKRDGLTLGELVLKGSCLLLGYLKDPEATAKCIDSRNGWMYTGDVAVMHSDGYLEIKDRSKDVIITGGENVSSVEVESALYGHPEVDEAAVVARPHDFWGESPCAFVKLKNGIPSKPTEKEILEYCRDKLPHYMAPKWVVFIDELPKTSTGKIQKFLLKEIAKAMGSSSSSSSSSSPSSSSSSSSYGQE